MKAGPFLLLAAAAVCFGLALADQYSSGELYRRASSLRTDQEGSSVWFEALAKTGIHVDRNYAPLDALQPGSSALILLGVAPGTLNGKETADAIEKLAKSGSRVTLTLEGSLFQPAKVKTWDLEIAPTKKQDDDDENNDEDGREWRNHFVVGSTWSVIREQLDKPVVIERKFGTGVVAISAATAPFLNQSLQEDRDLALLNWAIAGKDTVIFDESHLGSTQSGTIVGLIRRFRLQGVAAALFIASLLFVWRASVPFPPVADDGQDMPAPAGTTSGDALSNLLERRIPPAKLISVCVQEWSRDFSRRAGQETVREASKVAEEKGPDTERWERVRSIVHAKKTI